MGQTGLAILQIMFYFSWPVVCIESRSNQLVAYYFIHGSTKAGLLKKFLGGSWHMPACWTARCCHCLWHGCQHCQCLADVRCYQTEAFLRVSESRDCDSIWSSPHPEMHQEPFPQIWCVVQDWANAQPASCHCNVGTHFKCVRIGQKYCPPFLQNQMPISPMWHRKRWKSAWLLRWWVTVGASRSSLVPQGKEHCSSFIVFNK